MSRKRTRKDYITEAAQARSDLNIFYAVIALMEGGLVSSPCSATEGEIVALCKHEAAKCLVRMDRAVARANS